MRKGVAASLFSASLLVLATTSASANELVVNGDFSAGNSGFSADYTFKSPIAGNYVNHGVYNIAPATQINDAAYSGYGNWDAVSTDANGGNSNVLLADAATVSDQRVWYQSVNVTSNTDYTFSFYGVTVDVPTGNAATLDAYVNGSVVGTLGTSGSWKSFSQAWNSDALSGAIELALVDTNTSAANNDFAIGNISFQSSSTTPVPPSLPLFASGLLGFAFVVIGRRRKYNKTAAQIAA